MRYHALVPAAGSGSRMGGDGGVTLPKQYLPLAGRPMIWHALATLCATPAIASVFVVLAPDDSHWPAAVMESLGPKLRVLRCGGETRAASVTGGLRAMASEPGASGDDWVLVHDAARCMVTPELIDRLIDACVGDAVGGLLAIPVSDTVKRTAAGRVAETVDRSLYWLAQTPQMFRLGALASALLAAGDGVTDEASAIEAQGLAPRLVEGDRSNFKVTVAQDFIMAEAILLARQRAANEETPA